MGNSRIYQRKRGWHSISFPEENGEGEEVTYGWIFREEHVLRE